jgi:hypothetical protein
MTTKLPALPTPVALILLLVACGYSRSRKSNWPGVRARGPGDRG